MTMSSTKGGAAAVQPTPVEKREAMSMEEDFTIVDPDIAKQIKTEARGRGNLGPKAVALMEGQTIFLKHGVGLGGMYGTLQRRGFKVRSRQRDGGTYVWAEKSDG